MEKLKLNKGFSLIEFLIVILTLTLVNNLYIKTLDVKSINSKINTFNVEFRLLDTKFESLLSRQRKCLSDPLIINNNDLCFNERGNINMAQTIRILNANKHIVIHLGAGIYEIK